MPHMHAGGLGVASLPTPEAPPALEHGEAAYAYAQNGHRLWLWSAMPGYATTGQEAGGYVLMKHVPYGCPGHGAPTAAARPCGFIQGLKPT